MATDLTTIQKTVTDKLNLLNSIYFKGNNDSSENSFLTEGILGGSDGYKTGADSIINTGNNSIINQLYNLNNTGIKLPNFININSSATSVDLYKPTNTYTGSYTSVALTAINNEDLTPVSEINCLSLLTLPTVESEDTTSGKIYNFMQGLHTLYNLFEANTWQSYLDSSKNNTESAINFGIPYLDANGAVKINTNDSNGTPTGTIITGSNLKKYVDYVSPTLLNTISFSTTFNPYVARRLMYIWILVCNYLIATAYLDDVKADTNKVTNASNLVKKTYELIIQANKNVINNDNPITSGSINDDPTKAADGDSNQEEDYEKAAIKKALLTWATTQINVGTITEINSKFTTFKGTAPNTYPSLKSKYDEFAKSKNSLNQYIYPKLINVTGSTVTVTDTIKTTLVNNVISSLTNIFEKQSAPVTVETIKDAILTETNTYTSAMNTANPSSASQNINVFGSINSAVGEYIDLYNNNQTNINYVSELLKTGKAELSTVKNLLDGRLSTQKTQRICEYIAIAILIIFAMSSFSILLLNVDKRFKLFACIGLILFALLHFLGIQMLLNSSIFIMKTPSKPLIEKFTTAVNSNNISNYLNYYNIQVMTQVSEYLDNTFTLVTLLESHKAYGNVNLSMDREIDYYNTIVSQLNNAQSKINNVYFSSYINTIDVSALLQLFQVLTIIIAATTTLFVLVEDVQDNSIRNWIASIAGIFAVFAFLVYLLEVNTRVRTNPVKIYWGDVDKTSFRD